MKSANSQDELGVKVQQSLFEYFYSHHKACIDGTFSPPRSIVKSTTAVPGQPGASRDLGERSAAPKSGGRPSSHHRIHKLKDGPLLGSSGTAVPAK